MSDMNTATIKVTDKTQRDLLSMHKSSAKDIEVYAYLLAKSQRVAETVWYILGDTRTDDVLENDIKRASINLVNVSLRSVHRIQERKEVMAALTTLTGLFALGGEMRVLSRGNAQLLANACLELSDVLTRAGWFAGHAFATEAELDVAVPGVQAEVPRVYMPSTETSGHTKATHTHSYTATPSPIGQGSIEHTTPQRPAQKSHYIEKVQRQQKDRRATILGILQQKDRITIKDVTEVIRDVSEKTVQRELLGLVEQGVLKKEGERRWSTYSLA
jgi:predicted DNA-binding transcriptional regulator